MPAVLRADLRQMLATPPKKRTVVQKYLAEKFEKGLRLDLNEIKRLDPGFKKLADDTARKREDLQGQLLPGAAILALWDRGEPSSIGTRPFCTFWVSITTDWFSIGMGSRNGSSQPSRRGLSPRC